jgi:hypothetical protein
MHRLHERGVGETVVDLLSTEQLLLKLAEEGGTDVGILNEVHHRLVKTLGDHRESVPRVQHLLTAFLEEQEEVGGPRPKGGSRKRGEGEGAAHA